MNNMKITIGFPPNIEEIREHFDVPDNAIFTFKDTIYNPNGILIDEHLMKHEANHTKQQGSNPNAWWNKYLTEDKFRLDQELECYRIQYRSAKRAFKDREELNRYLHFIAAAFSSPMYGSIITYSNALEAIKKL